VESQLADFIEIQSPNRLFEVIDSLKDLLAKGVIVEYQEIANWPISQEESRGPTM